MDLSYILFNTLVYWLIAFVFAGFMAWGKFLNLWIWAIMIVLGYCIQGFVVDWFSWALLASSLGIVVFTIAMNWFIVHSFKNEKQRDLFGLVFTLWISILLENATNYIFGPNSVSFSGMNLSVWFLITLFVCINLAIWYIFGKSYFGTMMKWVYENSKTIQSLWIRVNKTLYWLFFVLFLVLVGVACMVLVEWNMRATDSLFYAIKGIWIMILVWVAQKQYMLWWALLYVLLEYLMFITFWRPIAYKETLILVVILLVLFVKPEGLFSFSKRNH